MLNKKSLADTITQAEGINKSQIYSFIKLFKIAPYETSNKVIPAEEALKERLIFIDEFNTPLRTIPNAIFKAARSIYGVKTDMFNTTFYSIFADVVHADPLTLLFDQILHYCSTYGRESIGLAAQPYIPARALDIPETSLSDPNARFTIIRVIPKSLCIDAFNQYLQTTRAPHPNNIPDITSLIPLTTLSVDLITSFEIKAIYCDIHNTLPADPQEFLRYVIYKITGQTLLIKNKAMRETIRLKSYSDFPYTAFRQYADYSKLSSIFFRNKFYFLCLKPFAGMAPIINDLRRRASIYHKPLKPGGIKDYTILSAEEKQSIRLNTSTRNLIKLLNSLYARNNGSPQIFNIRNSRLYVQHESLPFISSADIEAVEEELIRRFKQKYTNKTFLVPEHISYPAPTSEKQFIGNIPFGTYCSINSKDAFAVGIHWNAEEIGTETCDIDLHCHSTTENFGWNADYCKNNTIVYSGDMTRCKPDAAEAFFINPSPNDHLILDCNLFTEHETVIPFDVFISLTNTSKQAEHYTYDTNQDLFPPIKLAFQPEQRSLNLGLFVGNKFYFYGGSLGTSRVPNANYFDFIAGLTNQLTHKVQLFQLLWLAGAHIVSSLDGLTDEQKSLTISLLPEDLTSTTLMDIVLKAGRALPDVSLRPTAYGTA